MHKIIKTTALALTYLLTLQTTQASSSSPEALQIINEVSLRQAEHPVSKSPNWNPQKILASAPPFLTSAIPDYLEQLQSAAGELELVVDDSGAMVPEPALLEGVDAVIGFCHPKIVANAPRLLWLHNYFVGMDECADLSEEQWAGRYFSNGKRLSGPAIAEHTIAMMMSLARGLPAYQRAQSKAEWDSSLAEQVRFGELKGKTLLVVGLGGIGTEVAWRAHGLGMTVLATRNSSRTGPDYVSYVGMSNELHELAGRSDVVVNALPLTPQTEGLFDKAFFDAIKPGAIFLSVGRGKSTVTKDLIAALESGKLYGAGLDVTDPEPLPADSLLWQMDNVIITPHTSAAGLDSLRRGAVIAAENLRRYVAGEPLLNIVNMKRGY